MGMGNSSGAIPMTSHFDQARQDIHEQLEELRAEMERCHQSFLEATAVFLADWYEGQVRRILGENPGKFGELPETTRSEIKREVYGLIDSTNATLRRFFANADIWWDQKDPAAARPHYEYRTQGGCPPKAIDEPLRFAMGTLLPVIEAYGFCATGFALRIHGESTDRRPVKYPYFRQRYQSSPEMVSLLDSYATLHTAAIDAERKLVDIDRDEARNHDQVLWDQA